MQPTTTQTSTAKSTLRLGFLGLGWIGRHRMESLAELPEVQISALADPDPQIMDELKPLYPHAEISDNLPDLLAQDLDGIVIATPSALHAEQAVAALEAGKAVFCQKPLGRSAAETRGVVDTAARADRLLQTDFSYRFTRGMQKIKNLINDGEIGNIYGINLIFHNAYGPDKSWFYNRRQSGGGCVIDLGIHLVDLVLWTMDFPEVHAVCSSLFSKGKRLKAETEACEDYAEVQFSLSNEAVVRLACSWGLPAGQEAVIEASFYGSGGGLSFRNVNGSFYDFKVEHYDGTRRETLVEPPDDWGGRAALNWANRLIKDPGYQPDIEEAVQVAQVIDDIYGR
ncbi:MAG: Gfo/Idh/MocA family oxidoreductase [Calditrichia bacterium]